MIRSLVEWRENIRYRALAETYQIGPGYKRIYFYHVRKAAGTSINHIFLSLGGEDGSVVYGRLAKAPRYQLISGDKVFVGWNTTAIARGNFFYAFSHRPMHELILPPNTYTFTCLRDPVKRVLSHYNMLLEMRQNDDPHPIFKLECKWLGDGFRDFLAGIPRMHLLNQLYMFSERFDVTEAFDNIMSCGHILFVDSFDAGINQLAKSLELPLRSSHVRRTSVKARIDETEQDRLLEMLKPEYALYERVRKAVCDA